MKQIVLSIVSYMFAMHLFGQEIKVSDNLTLYQLTENSYIHKQANNNGLIYINNGEAIIVSTPESDLETQNLIDWVRQNQQAIIIAYVIDRWHSDAMEGLDVVKKNEIKSISHQLTRNIAHEKGLPIPEIGFDSKLEITVGEEKVICHFLGESHTKDGIVVYIPNEQILFGGNGIRNLNGWVGNIGDANLGEWSKTAVKIKNEYGHAKVVVPGHGKHGGIELIDYTIDLYNTTDKNWVFNSEEFSVRPNFTKDEDLLIIDGTKYLSETGNTILKNATVYVQDATKYVKINAASINMHANKQRIDSDTGFLEIYDKTPTGDKLRIGVSYVGLIIINIDDEIGLRIVLREMSN